MLVHARSRLALLVTLVALAFYASICLGSSSDLTTASKHSASRIGASVPIKTLTFLGPGELGGPTHSILKLALEKSELDEKEYAIEIAPEMNEARSLKSIQEKAYTRAIRRFEARETLLNDSSLVVVRFPVYLGVLGYRVCYTNEKNAAAFAATEDINDLRNFKYGFVEGWRDIEIYKHNKYKIRESVSVSSLYKQLSVNRIDVVCRAVIELALEKDMVNELGNISLDKSKLFIYHMPYFFFMHKDNKVIAEKIEQGLINAYNDGSYRKLWEDLYAHHFESVNINSRKVIRLSNPLDEHIGFPYQKYLPHSLESL